MSTEYILKETENGLELFFNEGISEIPYCDANKNYELEDVVCVHIPDGVKSISNFAFDGFESLKTIDIPKDVEKIGNCAFRNCISLKSIQLPESLIGQLPISIFENCRNLRSIVIPNGITSIGRSAFRDCRNLESVSLPEPLVSLSSHAFKGCENLCSLYLPLSVVSIDSRCFEDCWMLKDINLPEGLKFIKDYTFSNCQHLKNIVLPNSLVSLGYGAFNDCIRLDKIKIPPNMELIEYDAFKSCYRLKEIEVSSQLKKLHLCHVYDDDTNRDISIPLVKKPEVLVENAYFSFENEKVSLHSKFLNKSNEVESLFSFLKNPSFDNFSKIRSRDIKIPLAIAYRYLDKRYEKYIKTCAVQIIEDAAKHDDFIVLDYMLDNNFLSYRMTDKCIEFMKNENHKEFFLALVQYKETIGGYDKTKNNLDRFDL